MKPASATRRGACRSIAAARASSNASRVAKPRCSSTAVAMPRARANSRPAASPRLLITADTGSPASTSERMLLPRPEMRTTSKLDGVPDHRRRLHPAVEVRAAHVTERERRFAKRGALAMRLLRDLGRAVVADVRRERGHEHERALEQRRDARRVRLDAARAVLVERPAAVGEEPRALQEGMDDHRLVDVELEM